MHKTMSSEWSDLRSAAASLQNAAAEAVDESEKLARCARKSYSSMPAVRPAAAPVKPKAEKEAVAAGDCPAPATTKVVADASVLPAIARLHRGGMAADPPSNITSRFQKLRG